MEKVVNSTTARLAVVTLCLLLLLAGPLQEAEAAEWITYPTSKMISCKVLGNCERKNAAAATRPGAVANRYTRGCNAIERCECRG